MKYIAKLYGTEIINQAHIILSKWCIEHRGYYGAAHGASRILVGFKYETLGLSQDKIIHSDSIWTSELPCTKWLRSSGNDHRIAFNYDNVDDYVLVGYMGTRHGMRDEFRELIKLGYSNSKTICYNSYELSWKPWQTKDDQVNTNK